MTRKYICKALGEYGYNEQEQKDLLEALEIALKVLDNSNQIPNNLYTIPHAIEWLNDILQKNFLRPKNSEREYLFDKFSNDQIRSKLLPLLTPFTKEMTENIDLPNKILLYNENLEKTLGHISGFKKPHYKTEKIYVISSSKSVIPKISLKYAF